ncbi:MAG: hypothetical protein FJZ62_06390 [Chlamydiae bacterium]|nr:hypothetical protein [Chlamydiota bacterium]
MSSISPFSALSACDHDSVSSDSELSRGDDSWTDSLELSGATTASLPNSPSTIPVGISLYPERVTAHQTRLENCSTNFLARLVKSRDKEFSAFTKKFDQILKLLEKEREDHNQTLAKYKESQSKYDEFQSKYERLSLTSEQYKTKFIERDEVCLSAIDTVENLEKEMDRIENENVSLKRQLDFIKKSASIGLIGLGAVAFVAIQLKKPQGFGASLTQIAKSFLFDRVMGLNRGALSIAKEAALEVANIANDKAAAVIHSATVALRSSSRNPMMGSDFTL